MSAAGWAERSEAQNRRRRAPGYLLRPDLRVVSPTLPESDSLRYMSDGLLRRTRGPENRCGVSRRMDWRFPGMPRRANIHAALRALQQEGPHAAALVRIVRRKSMRVTEDWKLIEGSKGKNKTRPHHPTPSPTDSSLVSYYCFLTRTLTLSSSVRSADGIGCPSLTSCVRE